MITLSEIREGDPIPTVTTEIYGVNHSYWNLQEAKHVADRFFEITTQSSGIPTIYIESAHSSVDTAAQHEEMIQDLGFAGTYLQLKIASRERRRAPKSEIASRIAAIDQTGNADESIRIKLLTFDDLYMHTLYKRLDELRRTRQFHCVFEGHETDKLRKSMSHESLAFDKQSEAIARFHEGDLRGAVVLNRESIIAFLQSFRIRERDMVNDLFEIGKNSKRGGGGTILFPVGSLHIPIADLLEKRNRRGKIDGKTIRGIAGGANTIGIDTYGKLRVFEQPTDVQIGQTLLLTLISQELPQFLMDNRLVEIVGNRYDDIYPHILGVVGNLDYDVLQRLSGDPQYYRAFIREIMSEIQNRAND